MSEPYVNQLYDYGQFLALQTDDAVNADCAFPAPLQPELAIFGCGYDSGHCSSGCSSYVDSPASNGTTYAAQSPTLMHSLINTNLEGHYSMESESSYGIAESQGVQQDKWEFASEKSIFESMNRATPYSPEEKKERIERYRSKKILRNFNKKIKYECRKTLADSRPRVRGRFARNDEIEKASHHHEFEEEQVQEEDDYSWINILDALNKTDALIPSF